MTRSSRNLWWTMAAATTLLLVAGCGTTEAEPQRRARHRVHPLPRHR